MESGRIPITGHRKKNANSGTFSTFLVARWPYHVAFLFRNQIALEVEGRIENNTTLTLLK